MCVHKLELADFKSPLSLEKYFSISKAMTPDKGLLGRSVSWDPNLTVELKQEGGNIRDLDIATLQKQVFPELLLPNSWLEEITNAQRKLGKMSMPSNLISNGNEPNLDEFAMQKMQTSQRMALGKWYNETMFRSPNLAEFEEIDSFCASVYQHYRMLDEGERFGCQPDVYSAIRCNGKIVGTLGYKFRNLPVKKTYQAEFPNLTHEIMRFSIHPDVGYRIEEIPVKILEKRKSLGAWQHAREYQGNYYRLVSVRQEIGRMLFANLASYYRSLANFCSLEDVPDLKISTHQGVIKFFNKCLGESIFQLESATLNEDSIDEQSKIAYKLYGFRLYTIKKEAILKERYTKEYFKQLHN